MLTQFRLWIGRYSLSAKLLTGIRDEREVRTGCYAVFLPPGNPSTSRNLCWKYNSPVPNASPGNFVFFSFFFLVFFFIALLRFYTWNKARREDWGVESLPVGEPSISRTRDETVLFVPCVYITNDHDYSDISLNPPKGENTVTLIYF